MRYTRYNINKKGKENFFLWIIFILLLATILGIGIYKIFIGNNTKEKLSEELNISNEENYELFIIQCGVYQNKDNADLLIKDLSNDFNPFIVEEDGKFKVIAGIYEKNIISQIEQILNSRNVNNFTIKCNLTSSNNNDKIKKNLISGYMQIINKLVQDENVKAIDTTKYKEWASSSILNDYNGNNNDINRLKEMINNMPKEYTKNDIYKDSLVIYNVIINCREN
ncbi:hypothetical protein ACTNDG_08530 [Clostridium sp. HCP1S3_B4]|uniref:hypothetical protein n=1 Tax=unclassified Clostridium TaxID=2614128 RepID=UPI0016A45ACB|nr:hypothetical protein [Clostridiales bacterium]NLK23659.1 SPOR domain-containing protein [Clostridiales bacterium]